MDGTHYAESMDGTSMEGTLYVRTLPSERLVNARSNARSIAARELGAGARSAQRHVVGQHDVRVRPLGPQPDVSGFAKQF